MLTFKRYLIANVINQESDIRARIKALNESLIHYAELRKHFRLSDEAELMKSLVDDKELIAHYEELKSQLKEKSDAEIARMVDKGIIREMSHKIKIANKGDLNE